MDQGMDIAAVCRHVMEPVRAYVRVTKPAQVRDDHFEARSSEGSDDAPPDALRLGPAVHEYEWPGAPDTLMKVRLAESSRRSHVHVESGWVDIGLSDRRREFHQYGADEVIGRILGRWRELVAEASEATLLATDGWTSMSHFRPRRPESVCPRLNR